MRQSLKKADAPLDDVTSGFNIGKNISLNPNFNCMLGFAKDDIIDMIEYYRSNGMINHTTDYLLDIMTEWYGNYRFSKKDDEKLFNADMVLYFLDHYLRGKELPEYVKIEQLKADAEEQLKKYSADEKFKKNLGKTTMVNLRKARPAVYNSLRFPSIFSLSRYSPPPISFPTKETAITWLKGIYFMGFFPNSNRGSAP